MTSPAARMALWLILLITCGVPLIWTASVIAHEPRTAIAALWDARLATLFGRTVLFSLLSAIGALLIALPIAIAMGRSYSRVARALWFVAPLPLLMPSIVVGYEWSEVLARLGVVPMPQSNLDLARCIFILSAWLFPIPAVLIGLSLRRTDHALLEQAALDGVLTRVLVRRSIAPAIVALLVSLVLAMQEFAIFEPTGISVMATEVRMIFETGLLSSSSNPIATLVGGVGAADTSNLAGRAALALAAGAPVIALTVVLCAVAYVLVGRLRLDDAIDLAPPPQNTRAHGAWTLVAWIVVAGVMLTPVLTMAWVSNPPFNPVRVGGELQPQIVASLLIAGTTGIVGISLASLAAVSPPRFTIVLALASFLLGGQFTAIALLRVLSDSDVGEWVRNRNLDVVIAHVARFAWIALLAGSTLHAGAWRGYREMAGVDGASAWQAFARVIVGVGWPVLGLAGLLMFALSLTEVPATALLVPPSLVPLMLSWVHQQRYGPMMNASLMLTLVVVMIGWTSIGLWMAFRSRQSAVGSRQMQAAALVALVVIASLNGCDDPQQPVAVWGRAGRGPGEMVYPRAIAQSPDGTFFIVDRVARIQHLGADGKFLNDWQMAEWSSGKPVGLTVDREGNLWVADTHYHRVIVFTPDGREIKRFGAMGSGEGEFDLPTDIAFDAAGNVYVSEYGQNNRVQVFDASLKFVRQIGKTGAENGEFLRPQSIAIVGDKLYVSDSCNHRIGVFGLDGTFIANFGHSGSAPGEYRFPYGLELDDQQNLIVTEFGNNRVQKIDRATGAALATWGATGRLPGELNYPWASVARGDRVIVVDAGNNRLQVFRFAEPK